MAFSGSTYSRLYDFETDRDGGVKILASKVDAEFDGLVTAINQIMDGSIPFTGTAQFSSGTVSAPAITFSSDTDTGFYRIDADRLGVAVGGVKIAEYDSAGLDLSSKNLIASEVTPSTINSVAIANYWHSGNDGASSGLDADLLDGQHGSYYRDADNINAGTISDARLPSSISSDITGTANNASQLDSQNSSYYRNASNLNAGTISDSRLPATITKNTSGTHSGVVTGNVTGTINSVSVTNYWHSGNDGASSGLDADLLDGQHGSYYQNASNINSGTISNSRLSSDVMLSSSNPVSTAWVSISGTSYSSFSVRDSYNVSSVSQVGSNSQWRITFSSSMSNTNFAVVTGGTNNQMKVAVRNVAYIDLEVNGSTDSLSDINVVIFGG